MPEKSPAPAAPSPYNRIQPNCGRTCGPWTTRYYLEVAKRNYQEALTINQLWEAARRFSASLDQEDAFPEAYYEATAIMQAIRDKS